MFHCLKVSKHISISVLFFIISVPCFVYIAEFLKMIAPGGGALARFFCPRGRAFALSLFRGGGIRPFKKFPLGLPGGVVKLGIDWYIRFKGKNTK